MKKIILSVCILLSSALVAQNEIKKETVAKGVIKLTCGIPEKYTPYSLLDVKPLYENIEKLDEGHIPFSLEDINIIVNKRGCQIEIPLFKDEQLYGFGMQTNSFGQRGLKKKPIVNDHPQNSLGASHAPQTFYVSDRGYGILVNTTRYTTFLCGTNSKQKAIKVPSSKPTGEVFTSEQELYKNEKSGDFVYIDIPNTQGVEIFVFSGTNLLNVVQRYNLFSGGGAMPPLWGLGFKYRTKTDFTQEKVLRALDYLREKQIPCDVFGLEPGWQTASYSCSYVWNEDRFPDHKAMISELESKHIRLNLWEHAYVHPTSPIWEQLKPYSGDFMVWGGLVPDFTLAETKRIFKDYHKTLIAEGVSGFKLDECDNSNVYNGSANWGFPDMTLFPSGMDGEQMHQIFGSLYAKTLNDIYVEQNTRTYQDYRASGVFMSSIPAVLYSDIYGHKDYVQMMCTSAFGGLLWSPEVRRSDSDYDFFHRFQTALLSPIAVNDNWFLENPPWLQYDKEKNNNNEFLPNAREMEDNVRKLVNIRMQLIPYLYDAFANYYQKGIPPFRPLVMDFPTDKKAAIIDHQYMMGAAILVTPLFEKSHSRKVYFPSGCNWYNFNTNEKYEGGKEYDIIATFSQMPIFVKEGAILPLSKVIQYVADNTVFEITPIVYGQNANPATLFEDDGLTYNYKKNEFNTITLSLENGKRKMDKEGTYKKSRYKIQDWIFIK
ncbi:TIM-barrel domain-containing protein [uncultured Dysgonomonas sp.]|uniref:Alpha-xylosidase n=1 Tax=uncultured Dysgonomonas sp. TaxID=206096 RepID=A0A212JW08_9BACT|nr:TIM-barrel domain-containing protein [uncultured Dysgonomonas sp.]SBW03654.1 Alpha-xylosidase [uncultured Dysgonomonas sp.]